MARICAVPAFCIFSNLHCAVTLFNDNSNKFANTFELRNQLVKSNRLKAFCIMYDFFGRNDCHVGKCNSQSCPGNVPEIVNYYVSLSCFICMFKITNKYLSQAQTMAAICAAEQWFCNNEGEMFNCDPPVYCSFNTRWAGFSKLSAPQEVTFFSPHFAYHLVAFIYPLCSFFGGIWLVSAIELCSS